MVVTINHRRLVGLVVSPSDKFFETNVKLCKENWKMFLANHAITKTRVIGWLNDANNLIEPITDFIVTTSDYNLGTVYEEDDI